MIQLKSIDYEKNIPFQAILIAIVQWVFNSPMSAQSEWLSPLQWKSLVQDPQKNLIIRDTVLYQSFDSDNPLSINYTVSGKYDFFYPREEGIQGASDSRAIRLYPGSTLTIDTLIYPALKMAEIHIPFAVQQVSKGDDLYFTTSFNSLTDEVNRRPCILPEKIVLIVSDKFFLEVSDVFSLLENMILIKFRLR